MKHLRNKLAQFKQWILSIVIARFLFPITFKKVPKKQFGRCVTCNASKVCSKYKVCKCSDEQQYDIRINVL
jgi:hypothetical protein